MSPPIRKLGEGKSLREIWLENDSELITNIMKNLHLDGGGKIDHFEKKAANHVKQLCKGGIAALAQQLYDEEYARTVALRKSALKRTALLQCRFKYGDALTFEMYEAEYETAINNTEKHSKKLCPNQENLSNATSQLNRRKLSVNTVGNELKLFELVKIWAIDNYPEAHVNNSRCRVSMGGILFDDMVTLGLAGSYLADTYNSPLIFGVYGDFVKVRKNRFSKPGNIYYASDPHFFEKIGGDIQIVVRETTQGK